MVLIKYHSIEVTTTFTNSFYNAIRKTIRLIIKIITDINEVSLIYTILHFVGGTGFEPVTRGFHNP